MRETLSTFSWSSRASRIARELIEMKVESGLGGFVEADLVGNDDAIACAGERFDRALPVARREVPAMQQDDGAAVGVALGRHVHIGHAELFALLGEGKQVDGIRIGKSLQRDAERLGGGAG